MTAYLDVTTLIADPRRSGIQRVERALIARWPDPASLTLCRFDGEGMRIVPEGAKAVLCGEAPQGGASEEAHRLAPFVAASATPVPPDADVLCAELFDDPARAAWHRSRDGSRWLLFDALPWTHPEWFPAGPAVRLMPYLHAAAAVRRAYISAASKRCFETIFRAPCSGPVCPLGADGLGLEAQQFRPDRRDVVMLGSIEPRKNTLAALEAFRALWREGLEARLVLIGRLEPDAAAERALLDALAGEARLLVFGVASDAVVRQALRTARVLLFPSEGEGYGLPPTEALASGLPVIVAESLPSLQDQPRDGQIRLARPDAAAIAGAIRICFDDGEARRLWRAAAARFPTWAEFAAGVAGWVRDGASPDRAQG